MKAQALFDSALKDAMKADFRGEKALQRKLDREKKKYTKLDKTEKKFFDTSVLKNPYHDSGVHYVSKKNPEVKRILTGIDMGVGEVLLADRLTQKGKKIDLIVGHHPLGAAFADLVNVMDMLEELYHSFGVPIHIAENLMQERRVEVSRSVHPLNHMQSVDAAKLLDISIINTHTISDNLAWRYVQDIMNKKKPETLGEVLELLKKIPEYQIAMKNGASPKIIAGNPENTAGKVLVDMTGGTNPHEDIYEQLSRYGVSTIVGMHYREPTIKKIKKHKLNLIIAGHYASDSLGMNLMLDTFEKKGVEIVPCSGLLRVSRGK
ncbi:NGG1p interacting factor NIF3 [Patescibacteria group bacterium]|nr:NGG1p interacting factor NIF3 [Patescibacteria group bacterium]